MIKYFNTLIFSLIILFFVSNKIESQNTISINPYNYNRWIMSNETCSGCGSFYLMVVNSQYPDQNGFYYYDIYLWSNSYYLNGFASSSYVKNIIVYTLQESNIYTNTMSFNYALVPPKSQYFDGYFHLGYIYSYNSRQKMKISWSEVNAW